MLTFFDSNNVIIKSIITEFKDINNIIKNESCIYEKITMEQKKLSPLNDFLEGKAEISQPKKAK